MVSAQSWINGIFLILFIAVDWYGGRYEKCSQRAQAVKAWLPESAQHDPPLLMDQVLFERALSLVSIVSPCFLLF